MMKMNRVFGVSMLALSMLAWNAYGIDNDVTIHKAKSTHSADTAKSVTPGSPATAAPFGDDCDNAGLVGPLASSGGVLEGDSTSATNTYSDVGSPWDADAAGCTPGLDGAPDMILEITVDQDGPWTFTTCPGWSDPGTGGPAGGYSYDSALIMFDATTATCPTSLGTLVDCDNDGVSGNCPDWESEMININLTAGTTYYLVVDSWANYSYGPFGVAYHGPCTSDQECTDRDQDNFCNGTERCGADGICVSAGDPCAGGAEPVCNEGSRICESCTASADPDATCGNDDDACNGIESCDVNTGGCIVTDPCPCGLCNNGTCHDLGACVQTAQPCRIDEDCDFFSQGQTCTPSGTGSGADCYTGRVAVGPDSDCTDDEVCVPNAANVAVCDENPCHVYRTDNSGYFGPGQGFDTYAADHMRLPAAPAGRDVVSYAMQIISRDGTIDGCETGPFDLTMVMWTAVDTDPLVDPNAGMPDQPIAGTECTFKDNPAGIGGPVGTPGRTLAYAFTCDAAAGLTGGTLIDGVAAGIDDWMLYTASTACQGFSINGDYPRSQGAIIGGTGYNFFGDSDGLPPGTGGIGWLLFNYSLAKSGFGNAYVCVQEIGPCCVGVAGCEMLSEDECNAQGGSYAGDNTCSNPITCEETGDGDGIADLCDNCPDDNNIDQADCDGDGEGDACEANEDDQDRDFDGTCNGVDGCPDDGGKIAPLQCGCGNSEDDADGDGVADCVDGCPNDPNKTVGPGICGCGTADEGDEDLDGVLDCVDQCRGVDDAIFAPECDGAIPTVSEWGLVILALLLLVAGKVYFGRRAQMA